MKPESLIAQRCIRDFMLANNYFVHTIPITKNLWKTLNHQANVTKLI